MYHSLKFDSTFCCVDIRKGLGKRLLLNEITTSDGPTPLGRLESYKYITYYV